MALHNDVNLSINDARILSAIFDPEALPSSVAQSKNPTLINPSLPHLPNFSDSQIRDLEARELSIINSIPSSPDESSLLQAIQHLNTLIHENPNYASAYVQRGMGRRLRLEALDGKKSIFETTNQIELTRLFSDLSTALSLANPPSPSTPISPFQARVLKTAYSHRAYLFLKASEVLKSINSDVETELVLPEVIQGKGEDELEEMASKDFAAAAKYGDEVAREMSVRTNPYARMCGAIVRNALKEEREEVGS